MAKLKKGSIHKIEITGLTHDGSGVGRINDQVVFIPKALPGDKIEVRLVHTKGRIAYGEIKKIITPSSERVEPWCPHGNICGGCQLQHLNYAAQLKWKEQQVRDAMARIAKIDVDVLPTLGMVNPKEYRNKAQFPFGSRNGQVVMGFFQRGTHNIVDITECGVQHPLITKLVFAVKAGVKEYNIEPYDELNHSGVLRHAVVRASFSTNKLMLILVTRTRDLPEMEELIGFLTREVPELIGIAHNVNPEITNVILGPATKRIWGEDYLTETIGGLHYAISPGSFFQINPPQTKVLYDLVKKLMPLTGKETILDLYCGAGTIGLYLAKDAKQIAGVEVFSAAVEDANYNASLNNIANAEFFVGKAEEELPKLLDHYQKIDGVIVDPPRKGCDQALLTTLVEHKIKNIVYVSCNPATLARDLGFLSEHGYIAESIQPVDMFPWTSHVETVVLMSKVGVEYV